MQDSKPVLQCFKVGVLSGALTFLAEVPVKTGQILQITKHKGTCVFNRLVYPVRAAPSHSAEEHFPEKSHFQHLGGQSES